MYPYNNSYNNEGEIQFPFQTENQQPLILTYWMIIQIPTAVSYSRADAFVVLTLPAETLSERDCNNNLIFDISSLP